jgi:hypothetical protein
LTKGQANAIFVARDLLIWPGEAGKGEKMCYKYEGYHIVPVFGNEPMTGIFAIFRRGE